MEDYYMSKCQTMSHGDIMIKKKKNKQNKDLMCQENSVTDVLIPEEKNATQTQKDNMTVVGS